VEANWPASAWLPAIVLLAVEAARAPRTAWMRSGLWLGSLLVAVIYLDAATLLAPRLGLRARRDPVSQAFGWNGVAREVGAIMRAAQVTRQGDSFPPHVWLAADRYQDAAQLSWSIASGGIDTLGVFSLNLAGRSNQYDLWPQFRQRAVRDDALVLILDETDGAEPKQIVALAPFFARIDQGPPIIRTAHEVLLGRQRAWVLRGWNGGWPGHSTPSIPES
jgi:hypothetical protein